MTTDHTIEKIKDVSELPNWFFKRSYENNLSSAGWFRQIRKRQFLLSLMDMAGKHLQELVKRSDFYIDLLTSEDTKPNSFFYDMSFDGEPISNLNVGETLFLASSITSTKPTNFIQDYESILQEWLGVMEEYEDVGDNGPTPKFGAYERNLPSFVEKFEDYQTEYNTEIFNYYERLGNPFLSYGRVMTGYPVTIDTQFDDKTIISHVQQWLTETRKKENTKAPRPFNQNDFDDWSYYKIREIFDLIAWSRIRNVKILDRVMAQALWPNAPDSFSPIDVYRTTARKKMFEIFTFDTSLRLYNQLVLEKGENFLHE